MSEQVRNDTLEMTRRDFMKCLMLAALLTPPLATLAPHFVIDLVTLKPRGIKQFKCTVKEEAVFRMPTYRMYYVYAENEYETHSGNSKDCVIAMAFAEASTNPLATPVVLIRYPDNEVPLDVFAISLVYPDEYVYIRFTTDRKSPRELALIALERLRTCAENERKYKVRRIVDLMLKALQHGVPETRL